MTEKEGYTSLHLDDQSKDIQAGNSAGCKIESGMLSFSNSDNENLKHTSLSLQASNSKYARVHFYNPGHSKKKSYDDRYDTVKTTVTIPVHHKNSLLNGSEFYLINDKCKSSSIPQPPLQQIVTRTNTEIPAGRICTNDDNSWNFPLKKDCVKAKEKTNEKIHNSNSYSNNDQSSNSNLLKEQSAIESIANKEGKIHIKRQHIDYGKVDLSSKYFIKTRRCCLSRSFRNKPEEEEDYCSERYTVNIGKCTIKPKFAQIISKFIIEKETPIAIEKVSSEGISNEIVVYHKKKIERPERRIVISNHDDDYLDLHDMIQKQSKAIEVEIRNRETKESDKSLFALRFLSKEQTAQQDTNQVEAKMKNMRSKKVITDKLKGSNPTIRSIWNSKLTNSKSHKESNMYGQVNRQENKNKELKTQNYINRNQKPQEDERETNQRYEIIPTKNHISMRHMSYSNKYIQKIKEDRKFIEARSTSFEESPMKYSRMKLKNPNLTIDSFYHKSQTPKGKIKSDSFTRENITNTQFKIQNKICENFELDNSSTTIEHIKEKHGLDQYVPQLLHNDADNRKKKIFCQLHERSNLSTNVNSSNLKNTQSNDTTGNPPYKLDCLTTGRTDNTETRRTKSLIGSGIEFFSSNLSSKEIYKNYLNHLSKGKNIIKINLDEYDFDNQGSINRLNDIIAKYCKSSLGCSCSNSGFICIECSEFFRRKKEMQIDYEEKAKLFVNLDEEKEKLFYSNNGQMKMSFMNLSERYQKSIPWKKRGNKNG